MDYNECSTYPPDPSLYADNHTQRLSSFPYKLLLDNSSTQNYIPHMQTHQIVALISRISERTNALIIAELETRGHMGLVPSHGGILAKLYEQGPLPMNVLAKSIDRKKNTVTTLVNKLENAGYVHRMPAPSDSRISLISLTDKGESFRTDFGAISEKILKTIWKDVELSQQKNLVAGLNKLLHNLG